MEDAKQSKYRATAFFFSTNGIASSGQCSSAFPRLDGAALSTSRLRWAHGCRGAGPLLRSGLRRLLRSRQHGVDSTEATARSRHADASPSASASGRCRGTSRRFTRHTHGPDRPTFHPPPTCVLRYIHANGHVCEQGRRAWRRPACALAGLMLSRSLEAFFHPQQRSCTRGPE